jgi:hypothetical protein
VSPKRVDLLGNVRKICMAFPEVTERLSHGAPSWFVRGKSTFVMLMEDGHHHNHFPHLWCAAPPVRGATRAPGRLRAPPPL